MLRKARQGVSRFFLGVFFLPLMQGCLYTSHHFNTARLLEPGQSRWEIGAGHQRLSEYHCEDVDRFALADQLLEEVKGMPHLTAPSTGFEYPYIDIGKNSEGSPDCRAQVYFGYDTTTDSAVYRSYHFPTATRSAMLPNFSLGWRLGVRKQWGPLIGVDIGWRLEAPTGPATLEFDARLGLPLPSSWSQWNQSLSLGWGIGAWADNSLFAEYALGWHKTWLSPFINSRLTYLATQPTDIAASDSFDDFPPHRRWVGQTSLGGEFSLPDILFLPRRIIPALTMTWPALSSHFESHNPTSIGLDWNVALGLSWSL